MIETYRFFIPGDATPKQGDRSHLMKNKAGGTFIHHYQPKKIVNEVNSIKTFIHNQLPTGFQLIDTPFVYSLMFIFTPLRSMPKYAVEDIRMGKLLIKDTKPDTDNLEKMVMDAAEGVVFTNDCKAYRCVDKVKAYGSKPGIFFKVETNRFITKYDSINLRLPTLLSEFGVR